MTTQHLIGFSLSLCIKDILNGKVQYADVLHIYTGCAPQSAADVAALVEQYTPTYWQGRYAEASDILASLTAEHKVGWLASWDKNACNIAWGHWLSTKNKAL